MGESTTAHHWRLLLGIGLLLLTSHSRSEADAVFAHAPPTITLADWPLYPQLPASFLATVDKVVITSFNPRSYQSPQIHALLVTKHGRVYLYGNSPQLGLDNTITLRELEEFRSRTLRDAVFGKQQDAPFLLILTEEGEIWSMGVNSMGQLGRKISDNRMPSAHGSEQQKQPDGQQLQPQGQQQQVGPQQQGPVVDQQPVQQGQQQSVGLQVGPQQQGHVVDQQPVQQGQQQSVGLQVGPQQQVHVVDQQPVQQGQQQSVGLQVGPQQRHVVDQQPVQQGQQQSVGLQVGPQQQVHVVDQQPVQQGQQQSVGLQVGPQQQVHVVDQQPVQQGQQQSVGLQVGPQQQGGDTYLGRASFVASSEGRLSRIEEISNVVEICAGAQHGLARDDQGRVFVWGYELRDEGVVPPTQVYPGDASSYTKAVNISCGLHHNAFLTQDSKVYIWGANDQGQLGTGNTVAYPRPLRLPWQPKTGHIKQLSCGSSHTVVLASSGTAYLWGTNSHGQLGLGSAREQATNSRGFQMGGSAQVGRTEPTLLTTGPFDMIMASGQMTLGCSKEGDLYAWGQIGGRNELVPVQYAVECERHRDLLRRGMTVDTGGMVSADAHAYGTDYIRKMLASFEAEITSDIESRDTRLKEEITVLLDANTDKYNKRLSAVAVLLLLAFVVFYILIRTKRCFS